MKSIFYDKTTFQTLDDLQSSQKWLTAQQVEANRAIFGENVLPSKGKTTFIAKFFAQFADLMIVILLISAGISFTLALLSKQSGDLWESLVIVAIVVLNATLGAFQEDKAEKQLQKLQSLTTPQCKVMRDGVVQIVSSNLVTVGDVVLLEAGDVVPADARLIDSVNFKVNESTLTGESLPIDKRHDKVLGANTPLAERVNCVYFGTMVLSGSATAVVFAVGKDTEMGKIALMLNQTSKGKTPLQKKLQRLSNVLGVVCLFICFGVLALSFVKGLKSNPTSLVDLFLNTFINAVSLAVAVIPEGLPAVVSVTLAGGISRMVSRNVIVKSLPAVETLGSASVICCDKTGTLTCNQMTLQFVFDGKFLSKDFTDGGAKRVIEYFSYCSNVTPNLIGDATEVAVVKVAGELGVLQQAKRVHEIPFDSTRKMMSVVVKIDNGYTCICKGAFSSIAPKCNNASTFYSQAQMLANRGLRVLAVACKKVSYDFVRGASVENNLTMLGLVALADPLRPDVNEAVATCKQAGIRTVMITGDSVETASQIATQLGIVQDGDLVLSGTQVDGLTDKQLTNQIGRVSVIARATPTHKLRVVNALQSNGQVVAMTGDGVNDAPALKRADVGCAMGSGTEVAKNTADMILVKDDFSTIVDAVAEGRGLYANIKRAVKYLLSCNVGEVLAVLCSLLMWDVNPLGAMQLLWINLVTDGLPGVALGMEKRPVDVMRRPPIKRGESIFYGQKFAILLMGVTFATCTLVAYRIGLSLGVSQANTMAFGVLAISQLFYSLALACDNNPFKNKLSPFTVFAFAVSLFLVLLVMFVTPLQAVFELSKLPTAYYLYLLALSIAPTAVSIIVTFCLKAKKSSKLNG